MGLAASAGRGQAGHLTLTDISDETALIAVQGPQAVSLVGELAGGSLGQLGRFHFADLSLLGGEATFSRTGYTGEDGFEIFCGWSDAPILWKMLTERGAVPAGLGARDVLRLEAAYPLYGHELDAETGPFESGVGWAVKREQRPASLAVKPSCRQKSPPADSWGCGWTSAPSRVNTSHVYDAEGGEAGETTSGTWSPTVKAGIAMARLPSSSRRTRNAQSPWTFADAARPPPSFPCRSTGTESRKVFPCQSRLT